MQTLGIRPEITPDKVNEMVVKTIEDKKFYGSITVNIRAGKIGLVEKKQTFEEI